HTEIDNELADHNHAAVVQEVGRVAEALRSVVDTDALELAQLAAIRFPGDPEVERANEVTTPIPEEPEVADLAVKRQSVDDMWNERDVEQMYNDDVQTALGSVVEDRAWYVRRLVAHAADLVGEIIQTAQAGDEETVNRLLAQRNDLVQRLSAAVIAWELALVAQMDGGGGVSEHVGLVHRWLDDAQGRS
ncbi:MAG: hypothetical protein ACRDLR_03470, partial [Gaiellaceae bacterium]